MPGCFLVIAGEDLDIDVLSGKCQLTPCRSWKRGDKRSQLSSRVSCNSGLKFLVSDAHDVRTQIQAAIQFLEDNRAAVQALISVTEVEEPVLDFGWSFDAERSPAQWRIFPIELLSACTAIGLGVEVSVYASSPGPRIESYRRSMEELGAVAMDVAYFQNLKRQIPFVPFEIVMVDGREFQVTIPETVMPTRDQLIVGINVEDGVPSDFKMLQLTQIAVVKTLTNEDSGQREEA